jgi:integrase
LASITPSQKATVKYFVIVALLFLAQVLVGGGTAHYRAEPGSFYGFDVSRFFPSNILRTCTWLAEANVPVHIIKALAGHSSLEIMEGYITASSEVMKAHVAKLQIGNVLSNIEKTNNEKTGENA